MLKLLVAVYMCSLPVDLILGKIQINLVCTFFWFVMQIADFNNAHFPKNKKVFIVSTDNIDNTDCWIMLTSGQKAIG